MFVGAPNVRRRLGTGQQPEKAKVPVMYPDSLLCEGTTQSFTTGERKKHPASNELLEISAFYSNLAFIFSASIALSAPGTLTRTH